MCIELKSESFSRCTHQQLAREQLAVRDQNEAYTQVRGPSGQVVTPRTQQHELSSSSALHPRSREFGHEFGRDADGNPISTSSSVVDFTSDSSESSADDFPKGPRAASPGTGQASLQFQAMSNQHRPDPFGSAPLLGFSGVSGVRSGVRSGGPSPSEYGGASTLPARGVAIRDRGCILPGASTFDVSTSPRSQSQRLASSTPPTVPNSLMPVVPTRYSMKKQNSRQFAPDDDKKLAAHLKEAGALLDKEYRFQGWGDRIYELSEAWRVLFCRRLGRAKPEITEGMESWARSPLRCSTAALHGGNPLLPEDGNCCPACKEANSVGYWRLCAQVHLCTNPDELADGVKYWIRPQVKGKPKDLKPKDNKPKADADDEARE